MREHSLIPASLKVPNFQMQELCPSKTQHFGALKLLQR